MIYTSMFQFLLLCFCLTAGLTDSSALRMLDESLNCNQPGLANCKINNCSDEHVVVPRMSAPTGPESLNVEFWRGKRGLVPVLNVTWELQPDSSMQALDGSQIKIVDERTNQSLCVHFTYALNQNNRLLYRDGYKWTFSLDEVEAEFGHTYMVTLFNLPEPDIGDYRKSKPITIPGCDDKRIQQVRMCLENGSLWAHRMSAVLTNNNIRMLSIVVTFQASQYSEKYRVSIRNSGILDSKNVSKENATSLNVTFEFGLWQFKHCGILIMIQPFFKRCQNNCWCPNQTIDYCPFYPRTYFIKVTVGLLVIGGCIACLLWRSSHKDPLNTSSSTAREQPQVFQVTERKRVFIIYSLDHPLYKNIVLKLCAFLMKKCGTEIVLDLLDSSRLGVLGKIQWLDRHKDQIENSSAKILILCSRGVQAKWRAMCGGKHIFLREEACSTVGDMLTTSLSLLLPHFIQSASFKKYIVAYFDGVSSEEDVPSPFNITVRYKLMKHFEDVFFRILDVEKQEPGRVKQIEGLSEDTYYLCPSGRALHDAIEAFRAYQLEHPRWFEEELLEHSELEFEETSYEISGNIAAFTNCITHCVLDPNQVISHHVQTNESNFTTDETKLYLSENFQMFPSVENM